MGSRRKNIMIYQRLLEQGVSVERLKQVHGPIGLDIGGLSPEELAVSIMSEIIMARLQAGHPLSNLEIFFGWGSYGSPDGRRIHWKSRRRL